MGKRAAEITTTTRRSYVQSNLLFGIGGGIQLADLRDIVAATEDYSPYSRVILKPQKVEVIETLSSPWINKGREESADA